MLRLSLLLRRRFALLAPGQELVQIDEPARGASLLPLVVEVVDLPAVQLLGRVGLEEGAERAPEPVVVAGGELGEDLVAVALRSLRLGPADPADQFAAGGAADLQLVVAEGERLDLGVLRLDAVGGGLG